jgi:AcrR family transcriptional regulator
MSTYEAVVRLPAFNTWQVHNGLIIMYKPNIFLMKNKENTKRKLLNAVGNIVTTDGFGGLGLNKVARSAGVSKILIYRYFGGFNELIRAYILEQDFWKNYLSEDQNETAPHLTVREQVCKMLAEQSNNFFNHCEMEAMLVMEISNYNAIVKNIVRGETAPDRQIYFNVVSTLLLAGTDHLILADQEDNNAGHAEVSSFRKTNLMQSISQIVDWTLG